MGVRLLSHACGCALCKNPALVQHNDIVIFRNFVDQMGGPQHRDTIFDEPAHVLEDICSRLDIKADCRLIQQEQARPMQERASDFDLPHLAPGEAANLVFGTV